MEGYTVLEAESGEQALELAQSALPDLILLDVMMPRMNGFETCIALKQDPRTEIIPIIMVTALRDVQYRVQGIEAGADDFLSRPHVREELMARARTLIRYKRTRAKLQEERTRLETLYNIGQSLNKHLDLPQMVHDILSQTSRAIDAERAHLILLDKDGQFSRRFSLDERGVLSEFDHIIPEILTKGLTGWMLRHQEGDIIDNVSQDERWQIRTNPPNRGSAIGAPLQRVSHINGVLVLTHTASAHFTAAHLSLLETIAAQISSALENVALFAEMDEERRKLGAVLQHSDDAILLINERLTVTMVNGSAERIFDVEASAVTGKPLHTILPFHPLVALFENNRHGPSHDHAREVTLPNATTLHVNISPIHGVGYAAVMQDITALKEAERLRLARERQEKERVKETFSRYMGPELVDHVLSAEPSLMARREKRTAVVMYADLRNWTAGMMSRLDPSEAVEQLNEFFTSMMDIALEHEGTVFELTGDELLVGFNAPFEQPDAEARAVTTAVAMQTRFNTLRQKWFAASGTEVGLGIGIDQGEVVLGNVGAESRMSFRMVGEVMSRAHRLVDLARDGDIVISAVIHSAIMQCNEPVASSVFTDLGSIPLKGIAKPQPVYLLAVPRTPLSLD